MINREGDRSVALTGTPTEEIDERLWAEQRTFARLVYTFRILDERVCHLLCGKGMTPPIPAVQEDDKYSIF
ncbi:hypothetical protein DAMNIGENAA_07200 [Desulforhabdus amnigena]|uniref:Uncharacterized protein n=1 Tax=Desulforhabdus amnigena TaxID=40218 RepID=A0A9W6FR85_9BACT|nr:hypothetical protein DAMNIGENAA_07200 [Desulforhabdus amnigena]